MDSENDRRVVHIVSELRAGGVEIRLLETLRELGAEAKFHSIYTVSGRKGDLAPQFEALGVRVVPQKIRSVAYPFSLVKSLMQEQPEAVQSYINMTAGYNMLLARIAGVRTRITNFRSDGKSPNGPLEKLRRVILLHLVKNMSTRVIGVTPTSLDKNFPAWRKSRIASVIPNGFKVLRDVASETYNCAELGTTQHGEADLPSIMHVGRADIPTKNRERAIEIAGELARSGRPHQLVFVGRHGSTKEQSISNLNRFRSLCRVNSVEHLVHFAGESRDVRSLLRNADCLLVTSTLEGLPGVVIEALLEDTPVVASDLPGVAYICERTTGVTQLSLDQPNQVWAETIVKRIQETRESKRSREMSASVANSEFNIERQIEALRGIWHSRE